jgi:hypothetical protein
MYCNQEIIMSQETGKWLPYNKDGSSHDCRTTTTTSATSTEIIDIPGKKGQKEPTIEQLKIWLARLEKIGIHIEIDSILKPQKDQKEK